MTYLVAFIVCFIAGIGAGLGTGFAGMSAAAVISPMLITFLGMDPYMAVGIALASDVLASAISAYTYGKNGNLDIKNRRSHDGVGALLHAGWQLCGQPRARHNDGRFLNVHDAAAGRQVHRAARDDDQERDERRQRTEAVRAVAALRRGVGFICGFIGAGGGMMMLLLLTSVLGYELKLPSERAFSSWRSRPSPVLSAILRLAVYRICSA